MRSLGFIGKIRLFRDPVVWFEVLIDGTQMAGNVTTLLFVLIILCYVPY